MHAWRSGPVLLSFYQAADPGGAVPAGWRPLHVDGRDFWLAPIAAGHAVLWRAGGDLYLLAGDLPEPSLLDMALSVQPGLPECPGSSS